MKINNNFILLGNNDASLTKCINMNNIIDISLEYICDDKYNLKLYYTRGDAVITHMMIVNRKEKDEIYSKLMKMYK